MDIEFHPWVAPFPMMSEAELAGLVADIRKNGLKEPIDLYEGKILDGRNRYMACRKLRMKLTLGEELQEVSAEPRDKAVEFAVLRRSHPLANQFPMMSKEEYEALREDIRESNIRTKKPIKEPICLFQHKILDGRNRYKACCDLGISLNPRRDFREAPAKSRKEAVAFGTSQNLQRRHLNASQQAMYLVRSGLVKRQFTSDGKRQNRTGDDAVRQVCKRYGVSHVSVYKALYVFERDPTGLAQDVIDRMVSVGKAEKEIRERESQDSHRARDASGRTVPKQLQDLFGARATVDAVSAQLTRLRSQVDELPPGFGEELKKAQQSLARADKLLKSLKAHVVCKKCSGKGCSDCGKKGWLSLAESQK